MSSFMLNKYNALLKYSVHPFIGDIPQYINKNIFSTHDKSLAVTNSVAPVTFNVFCGGHSVTLHFHKMRVLCMIN